MEPASTTVDETNGSSTVWIALALIVLTITALPPRAATTAHVGSGVGWGLRDSPLSPRPTSNG